MEAMSNHVKPIPEGYHSFTPYMMVEGADKVIEFLKHRRVGLPWAK